MILYTDESVVHGAGTPTIPTEAMFGVHSVSQEIDEGRMREAVSGSAFYGWHIPTGAWMPMEENDLDDYRKNLPEELGVILTGRAQTTEEFWRLRDLVKADTYLVGSAMRSARRG